MRNGWLVLCVVLLVACLSRPSLGGIVTFNDGSFSYQGYMEDNGVPANGNYSFRFEAFNQPVGPDIASEMFFISPVIPVIDGLFVVNVQMGGSLANAQEFWEKTGNQDMYLEIGVGPIEGGPYQTLGTRVPMGWGARAQYSGFSESLIFPYADSYTDEFFDPTTMMSLTSVAGGTVLELRTENTDDAPILKIDGETPFGSSYGSQNGALRIDAMDEQVGALISASQFALVGLLETGALFPDSAILGQVGNAVVGTAVQAINLESNNYVSLGTPDYAGDFTGDVIARDNLRVQGEATRDFASNSPSPIGPLAYGSISSAGDVTAGTANLSAVWNAASLRYEVDVAGDSIAFSTHTVTISVVDSSEPRLATFNTVGGDIWVKIWDLNSGNVAVSDNFSIVIHDSNPVVLRTVEVPDGIDADKYAEITGEAIVETRPRIKIVEPAPAQGVVVD